MTHSRAPRVRPRPEIFGDLYTALLGEEATSSTDAHGTPVVDVPLERWVEAARYAHDDLGMTFLDWLSAVDRPDGDPPGVEIVLHVVDPSPWTSEGQPRVRRMLLRTGVPDAEPELPSLTSVWPGVAWHERETYEMFGIVFDGFDDGSGLGLRPLLLPEGFEGTPLRKSFVLAARAVKTWPGAKEPGESDSHSAPSRRKTLPPGVPDPATWGPRRPGEPLPEPEAAPARPARAPRAARPPREATDG